ncbi:MAG: hypothetical protein JWQ38_3514 [Flavipsychrobacter sp.]|nr:hypothetical protein [Flavipsychrobacter sp.]
MRYFKIGIVLCIACLSACKPKTKDTPSQRTYRMGFQNSAPRYNDINLVLQVLGMWTTRADAAIISMQVPWDSLYAGTTPQQYVLNNCKGLVDYYRGKNLKLWVYIDPANGLNRSADASDLSALGRSIAQAQSQQVYTRFCFVMDSMLKPEHIGLALETNLIRVQSPDSIYQGIKSAANVAAANIRAYDNGVKLSVSIQADLANGRANNGVYQSIDKDFTDFPFIQELGISSYPYFFYDKPQDIPSDYYSRLIEGHALPVFIAEGGWSSQTIGTYTQTPQKQQHYITRQGELLDKVNAIAYFQLTFTDIDMAAVPASTPAILNQFAFIGLVDINLQAKPSLETWTKLFQRPLVAGN